MSKSRDYRSTMSRDFQCPICAAGRPLDVIANGQAVWVTAQPVAALPGYVCVVAKTHAVEPFDLSVDEQRLFWSETMAVARAVRDVVLSPKMNYEIHGNTLQHLHMHLYPRHAQDAFTGRPVDGAARLATRSPAVLASLAEVTQAALCPVP